MKISLNFFSSQTLIFGTQKFSKMFFEIVFRRLRFFRRGSLKNLPFIYADCALNALQKTLLRKDTPRKLTWLRE